MSANRFGLPVEFDDLPNFEFSKAPPASRDESARTDKAFGIKTFGDLTQEMQRRLKDVPPRTTRRR
jgi:hypothetical protein